MDRFWIDSARCELPGSIRLPLKNFPRTLQATFLDLLDAYFLAACDSEELAGTDEGAKVLSDLADDLLYVMTLPLDCRIWGLVFEPTDKQLHAGCEAILAALKIFIPEPGQGQPLEHYRGSLIPRLRDRDDPEFGRTVVVLEDDAAS